VAAWWLWKLRVDEEDTDAAATPTRTTERAMRRMASFILVTPFGFELAEDLAFCTSIE
jgi:hypothetical protein